MLPLLSIFDTGLALVGLFVVYRLIAGKSRLTSSTPPGPPGLPIVGNIFDIPISSPHLAFAEWTEKWGMFPSCVW